MQAQSKRARICHCHLLSLITFAGEGFGIYTRTNKTHCYGKDRDYETISKKSEGKVKLLTSVGITCNNMDGDMITSGCFSLHFFYTQQHAKAAQMRMCSLGTSHQAQHLLQQRQEQASWYICTLTGSVVRHARFIFDQTMCMTTYVFIDPCFVLLSAYVCMLLDDVSILSSHTRALPDWRRVTVVEALLWERQSREGRRSSKNKGTDV